MPRTKKQSTDATVREIRRRTRRKFAPEEKIRIVLEGLRGEQPIIGMVLESICAACVDLHHRHVLVPRVVQDALGRLLLLRRARDESRSQPVAAEVGGHSPYSPRVVLHPIRHRTR